MTLSYWVCECETDNKAYNLRLPTKKECIRVLTEERGFVFHKNPGGDFYSSPVDISTRFSPPHRIVVDYDNALDLLKQCLGEGGIYEGI